MCGYPMIKDSLSVGSTLGDRMPLRQFLYYDESLVNDFLSQLEGGQAEEVTRREQLQRDRKGELNVGAGPLKAGGGRGRSVTEETEAVIRQSRASNFERLHELLIGADELNEIEDYLDAETWERIKRGSLLEIDAQVAVPQMARLFSDPAAFANLASLMKTISPESIDADGEKVLEIISCLAKSGLGEGGTLTAVGNPPGSPYNLVMRLDRKSIIPGAELDGEATILAKMARKLKQDDKELVIDMPGMSTVGAELRRAMTEEAETGTLAVQGPGAVVVPIAIFR
jgi:hypothetical protein